ncbi:MAG: hypothetical protein J7J70_08075 [Deltaproteobacteria bacterium]|nr:hypothetical protein [Candidatus Tharpellaceae bacterium]
MMNCNPRKLLCFTLFSFLGILTIFIIESSAAAPMNENEISHLRQSVQALNQICQQASRELNKTDTAGNFSVQERHDYQTFIAYLGGRIEKYCRILYRNGGSEAVAGLNCPGNTVSLPILSLPAPQTTDEQVKDLETLLVNSLGDFDEILLEEQQHVTARQSRQRATGDSGNGGVFSAQDEGNQASTEENLPGKDESENSDQEKQAGKKGESVAADAGGGGGNRISTSSRLPKRDTLSADDDIVARQIREAAEKETDPELKKKLWEEYRKYKAGK